MIRFHQHKVEIHATNCSRKSRLLKSFIEIIQSLSHAIYFQQSKIMIYIKLRASNA